MDEPARQMLLQGLDQIGQTLLYAKEIERFESAHAY
jgi:3-isopropylmalate dehydratase small subunit